LRLRFLGPRAPLADLTLIPSALRAAQKKILEKVAPELRVDDACVATWSGVPFMTSAGPCTVPTAKGGLIK
jgi:aminoacyl tRNA synthase complex-interacting multifunctional protein 1